MSPCGKQGPAALAEEEIVVEQAGTAAGSDAVRGNALDGKRVARLVAVEVAQHVGELVGTLLVEGDDAPPEVGMQDGKAHAWLAVRLHIPRAVAAPVVVVAPAVDFRLATDRDAVDIAAEHLAAIDQQARMADAVVVVGGLAIIVGPQSKAYPAPRGEFTLNVER